VSRVAIVFTGGTISMRPDAAAGGNVPVLDGRAILDLSPEVAEIADVEPLDWGRVPASHLRFSHICDVARLAQAQLDRREIDGLVIVQGTDTIEETAFAFDLLLSTTKAVVVTGAMRDASQPDYDGPRNLADAVRCAVTPELGSAGVVVVMNRAVIAAEQAVKAHTTAIDAFKPRDGDVVARITDRAIELTGARPRRRALARIPHETVEDVHLVTVSTGMDGTLVRALGPLRPRGLVVAATGSGNTTQELLDSVAQLMLKGTVAVLTTRCQGGTVVPAYAFLGGGARWKTTGAILSGLDGPKSRVALALALSVGYGRGEIAELVAP
jgi:L-asparaginase